MTTPPRPEAIQTAQDLTAALNGMETRLGEAIGQGLKESKDRDAALAKYGRRNRILIIVAVIGLLLDMTATAVAVTAFIASRHNSATIGDVHQANLQGCEQNNVRLARQEASLDAILQPGAGGTPAQRAAAEAYLAAARAKIAIAWAPRDCQRAYSLNSH